MSYVQDPVDKLWYWVEDGQGSFTDIPPQAVGKIKPAPTENVDLKTQIQEAVKGAVASSGASTTASDFDVYWTTSTPEYKGSTFISGEQVRPFSSIESEFKNYSIKDPEYLRWVDALRKTEFGSNFPKKKTPSKGQVLSALRKAGQEASITGTSLQDLVYNNEQYRAGGTGTGLTPEQIANYKSTIQARALNLGFELTESQAKDIANKYAKGGMNTDVLDNLIAQTGTADVNKGQLAIDRAELKAIAENNAVRYSESWFNSTALAIAKGTLSKDTAKAEIINQAKLLYPAEYIVKGLDSNRSIRELASPATTFLAQVRGVDESAIPLDDSFVKRYLTARDMDGKPTVLPTWQFEEMVKSEDPTYPTSKLAQEEFTSTLQVLGRTFGKSIGGI